MANKPTWKSRDKLNPFVENQGSNRKLHTIRKLGPTRDAPNLKLGFTTKGGYEYGQTAGLKLWIQAQKSGVPTDGMAFHTIQHTSGTAGQTAIAGASGSLLTTKEDTPFIRFTPKPYRSTSRAIVFNSGSADTHFLHITSSQYVTLASGTAGTKNKSMSWSMWIKPNLTGSSEKQFPPGTNRFIFSKRSGSAPAASREYDLSIMMSGSLRFRLFDESVSKTVVKYVDLSTSGSEVQAGVWQNICVTYSAKTGSYTHQGIKIYRNGNLVSSGNAGTTQAGYVATENCDGDLVIGTEFTGSITATQFYRGKMAEIALWHVALEANEVKALYDARRFFGRMDTSAIDHLRQGVSILTNKQRWRSSNAPKISGISRLSQDEKVSHEQDQTLYGQGKIFRDDTPFEEMADAGRLRKQIDRTIVGSKASSSIEFRGFQPETMSGAGATALILTGSDGTKKVFYFRTQTYPNTATKATFAACEFKDVYVNTSDLNLATGSIGQGTLWAASFMSAINDNASSLQIAASRAGNIVKLISTVTGTSGNTYINPRRITSANTSTTGTDPTSGKFSHDANGNLTVSLFMTGTFNTSSIGKVPGNLGVLAFIGGNSTMKHVVTQALGGAIDYLRDPGKQQYPIIITNVSMRDPSQFDGNIEPLIIRDSVSHTSIDAPFVAHDVRGTFMGGEGNILFGSSQIEQFYDNKNPASSDTQVKSAPAGARRFSAETIPFFDAQDVVFALPAKPSYAYLRFACVPNNHDKIVMTDTSGQQVCFEFVNSTNLSTRSFGKLRNRPHKSGGVAGSSGRGTWRVLLTGTSATAPGTGVSLTTGSQTTSAVAAAMSLFRNEIGLAQTHRRLMLTCSDRRLTETYTSIVDEETTTHVVSAGPFLPSGLMSTGIAGTTYTYSTAVGKRTYVRLDQLASGSDGNRVIDFRFRGASSGTYIVNGVTASNAYQAIITAYSGALGYQNRRTRIKFIRNLAYRKYGMGFLSGSNMFILPMDGFVAEITRKITPFSDNKMLAVRRIVDGLNVGPATLLTSTLGGVKEWNELGHGYKSSGTGFTYNNDMFGTDSIAFGGRKR